VIFLLVDLAILASGEKVVEGDDVKKCLVNSMSQQYDLQSL
jgi:hypothetical protein